MDQYLFIIGKVAEEGSEVNEEKIFKNLERVFERINDRAEHLVSPYTITGGGEFQAVYSRADNLFGQLIRILAALYPASIQFCMGIGEIESEINWLKAIGMEGPAVERSREGLSRLEYSGYLFHIVTDSPDSLESQLINSTLGVMSNDMKLWQKNRLQIMSAMMGDIKFKEIASLLGISLSTVYKNNQRGDLENVRALFSAVTDFLNREMGN